MQEFDLRKLKLLLRSGIETNPGPKSDEEWTPHKLKPLPVPRVKAGSKSISTSEERRARQRNRPSIKTLNSLKRRGVVPEEIDQETEVFVCECGLR